MNSRRKLLRNKMRAEVGNKGLKYEWSKWKHHKVKMIIKDIKRDLKGFKKEKDVESVKVCQKYLSLFEREQKFLFRRSQARGY